MKSKRPKTSIGIDVSTDRCAIASFDRDKDTFTKGEYVSFWDMIEALAELIGEPDVVVTVTGKNPDVVSLVAQFCEKHKIKYQVE